MTTTDCNPMGRACRLLAASAMLAALGACSVLNPPATPAPAFYSLDHNQQTVAPVAPAAASGPTLMVGPTRAAAGFDSQRIIYLREPYKLEYFANSEWVDPPARMLSPLLVAAIESSGAFRAVVLTTGAASGDLRLDTEIIRLQHDFQVQPSRVRFTLRATLVDDRTRRVVAARELDRSVESTAENPYGGVVAANRAVSAVLVDLARFCAETVRAMPPTVAR